MSTPERNDATTVAVDPSLGEILREQSLVVLEFNHGDFEEACDLEPSALLALVAIFRDAFAVLDTVGWLPGTQTETIQVAISHGHAAQLQRRRVDLATTILDRLDIREDLSSPQELAEIDDEIEADWVAAHGLQQILLACTRRG